MKQSGQIEPTDTRLFRRDHETGRAYLVSWGDADSAADALERDLDAGYDSWLVSPDEPSTRQG